MRTLDEKDGESTLFALSLASEFFFIGRSVMVLMLKFNDDKLEPSTVNNVSAIPFNKLKIHDTS